MVEQPDQEAEVNLEEQLETLQQHLAELQELVKSAGWGLLAKIASSQQRTREAVIIASAMGNIEEVLEVKQMKAERTGIELFLLLPETLIEQYKEDVQEILFELEADEENEDE
jgi:50S ribosomal subunit-associated GTPase HflX